MAACKAAKTSSNVSSSTSNFTTNTTSLTTTASSATATPNICHNFHELCRSCGKTNDQLYDLFQSSPNNNSNTSSPFNTSSTTCYTHLNNNNNSCSTLCSSLTSTNKTSTSITATTADGNSANAVGCTKSGGNLPLDTLAATAKASAKGQSNMENILQEMQIWQLMIKCNDGLPQRICAKCTAQFYMIHKFRRKCLKVQTQLRALKEEQKIHEPQHSETATVSEIETEARIEPALQQEIVVKAVKSMEEKDLVNDKCVKQEEEPAAAALVNNNNATSSVSFETIVGNTSQDDKTKTTKEATAIAVESSVTLLDNVDNAIKTMPQIEAAEEEVNNKLFVATQDQSTLKKRLRLKEDEKKPLLKAVVLKSTTLTLQQPLREKCDNEEDVCLTNPSKKLCLEPEDSQTATAVVESKQPTVIESLEEMPTNASQELENSNTSTSPQDCTHTKISTDSLLVTKAALKAYNVSKSKKLQNSHGHLTNLEAKANNDNNNNAAAASSSICDNPSEINDNTCSSTSSSTSSFSSSPCSSQSSPSSIKPFRTKIIRQKIVRYVCLSRRSSGYASKMQKLALNQLSKTKQRSWRNKHKLKHLNAMRICASTTMRPEIRRKNKQYKNTNKNLQFEDETSSSTVSTTSTTTSSSSSPSTLCSTTTNTTTPAVTNVVAGDQHEEQASSSSYSKNAKEPGCCPSMEGISSNKYSGNNTMWKTKAAMKANANDMTEAVFVAQNTTETLSQTTAELTGSACLAADISSKTLKENQSNITSSTCSSGNNNILMQHEYSLTNKENDELNTDNQVKDIEDESATNLNKNNKHNNLWSSKSKKETNDNTILNTSEVSVEKEDQNVQEGAEKTLEVVTPPAKFGGMKLIIQRKRGERFKCRRMEDENATATNIQEHIQNTTPKRRKKSSMNMNLKIKLDLDKTANNNDTTECNNVREDETPDYKNTSTNESRQVPAFNSEEDENKENPIDDEQQHDFDSDSNVSLYRDPLLIHNEMLEEDTNLIDFPKAQLSLQTECSKEMYKLYKEKANLESPKKLIVRVPLTSLTQDFKRMHLTMDQETEENQENNKDTTQKQQGQTQEANEHESTNADCSVETPNSEEHKETSNNLHSTSSSNVSNEQSDLLGFSQNTETSCSTVESSQPSVEMVRYVEPPLCSASSKINDFINDFQNNCIDSSEIEEAGEIVPHLGPQISQELSDEIRDVENTLNGILSEMHDKDMYTPRSAETDEFFTHSVYSPLTDTPTTTPAHSFYAESPCTINSNPMSVSPFIHQNMDYNAMTPQSNHSSMGHSSYMGSGSSAGGSSSHAGMFSEHFPTYNECFEETTQSELIGFQNDIPCFENIDISNNTANNQEFSGNPGEYQEEEEIPSQNQIPVTVTQTNSEPVNVVSNDEIKSSENVVEYIDLSEYQENTEEQLSSEESATQQQQPIAQTDATLQHPTETVQHPQEVLTNQVSYQPANYQANLQMPNANTNLTTQPHYIVTNTNQGPIIIANPHLNTTTGAPEQMESSFKPHGSNLQFVTLGQAMKATNHTQNNQLAEINWPTTVNTTNSFNQPPPIVTANNGGTTTTYFINANGEVYQARINTTTLQNPQTPGLNTILVPTTANTNQTFNKATIDNNENYMPTQQTQPTAPPTANNGQYIMLVNNLGGTPQYYATTTTAAPTANPTNMNQNLTQTTPTSTVLFQGHQTRQLQTTTAGNYVTNSSAKPINTNPKEIQPTKMPALVPISPNLETDSTTSSQRRHQMINQHLQRSIKQRQFQLLQPRSPNVTQKITLICRFCHKRPKFNNNVDYSNHIINTHPAEKPYNCPHCPMHFSRRFERQQHVAQVHGSRYQCAQCGLSFCAQRTLDFHLQKYHANTGRSQQQQQLQHQQQILNSTSKITTTNTSTASATAAAATAGPTATYQLLQQNQQQRLVRVEDVHVQMTGENKNKRSININLDSEDDIQTSPSMPEVELLSASSDIQQKQQQQHTRKLCCPDCNGDNDDCCGSNKNDHDQQQQDNNNINLITPEVQMQQPQFAGNESVNNHHQQQQQQQQQQQPQHITIPSPEQTEPDSTTTLRHFRKRQLSDITPPPPHFATSPTSSCSSASSSSSSSSSSSLNIVHAALNNNDNLNHNNTDNVFAAATGEATATSMAGNGIEQIMVERSLRATHNCLLCEDSFTNEIALRKHHHMVHGATGTQSSFVNTQTATTSTSVSPLMCTICKRSFRMRNALQRHMETHDAEGRPYECNICQVRFPRPSQLTLHKLTVHKFEKPISCEECGKLFGTETAMKAHAKEHKEAASLITASSATASTSPATSSSSSSSLSSSPPQFSSHLYLDAMTTKPSSISTTTTTTSSSSSAIITNVQNIILQSTTSGDDASSPTAPTNFLSNNSANNINNNAVVAYNIATQNTIVSGLST